MPNYQKPATPEEEKISAALDILHPGARSRTVVEYEGRKYQLCYFPITKSAEGEKVKEWGHRWILL